MLLDELIELRMNSIGIGRIAAGLAILWMLDDQQQIVDGHWPGVCEDVSYNDEGSY
jgi:hypothetical protein